MLNKRFFFIKALILSIVFVSCEADYLDTKPTGSVDAGSAYATTKNAQAAVNGIYRAMIVRYQGSQGHFGYPALMIINDVMAEDMVFPNASNTWHFAEQRWLSADGHTSTSCSTMANATMLRRSQIITWGYRSYWSLHRRDFLVQRLKRSIPNSMRILKKLQSC